MTEPHEVLGVAPDASPEAVKAAYRALVKALHPDLAGRGMGADSPRLAQVNAAYAAWRAARRDRAEPTAPARTEQERTEPTAPARTEQERTEQERTEQERPAARRRHPASPAVAELVIDAFRPVAFEALVLAAADLGDITDAEEPFALDVHVDGPPTGFCRIELVPEAGASLVTVESDQVDAGAVRDQLVLALHAAGVSCVAVGR